jgi:hypothetical protein
MKRNPYVEAFDLRGGEVLTFDERPSSLQVYFMTQENLEKYCAGRNDIRAEMMDPISKELIAGFPGRCYLVSETRLEGGCTIRRGVRASRGVLSMKRFGTG